jgi:ABC-type multidrug transport system ATPase subunit
MKMLEKMTVITVPLAERTIPFKFYEVEELASPILELDKVDMGYAPGKPVLDRVSLRLDFDDRIAIVGANGQGKTTLVKSIAQKLPLLQGVRRASKNLRIGYFSQDQLDELRAGESVLDHVRDLIPNATQAGVRALAAQFGFGAEKCETKVDKLSGGEKVRLLMGLTTYKKPHILILDEPTSHLDIDSREALIYALNEFNGALLIITHDTYLAEATADRLWLVNNGKANPYEGDLADYKALVLAADRPEENKQHAIARAELAAAAAKEEERSAKAEKPKSAPKMSFKQKHRIEQAEKDVEKPAPLWNCSTGIWAIPTLSLTRPTPKPSLKAAPSCRRNSTRPRPNGLKLSRRLKARLLHHRRRRLHPRRPHGSGFCEASGCGRRQNCLCRREPVWGRNPSCPARPELRSCSSGRTRRAASGTALWHARFGLDGRGRSLRCGRRPSHRPLSKAPWRPVSERRGVLSRYCRTWNSPDPGFFRAHRRVVAGSGGPAEFLVGLSGLAAVAGAGHLTPFIGACKPPFVSM